MFGVWAAAANKCEQSRGRKGGWGFFSLLLVEFPKLFVKSISAPSWAYEKSNIWCMESLLKAQLFMDSCFFCDTGLMQFWDEPIVTGTAVHGYFFSVCDACLMQTSSSSGMRWLLKAQLFMAICFSFFLWCRFDADQQQFWDETIWHMRDKSKDKDFEGKPYYGFTNIKRLSNMDILMGCFAIMALGAILHYYALRYVSSKAAGWGWGCGGGGGCSCAISALKCLHVECQFTDQKTKKGHMSVL